MGKNQWSSTNVKEMPAENLPKGLSRDRARSYSIQFQELQGNTVLTQTSGEMADTPLIHVILVLNLAMDEN